jgi:hypothetical protein
LNGGGGSFSRCVDCLGGGLVDSGGNGSVDCVSYRNLLQGCSSR